MTDRIWREAATAEELATVERIDKDMANLAALRSTYAWQRYRITNRACSRARYRQRVKETRNDVN